MNEADVKPITLRNLPPEIARIVRRRADEKGISLNRAVIELLDEAFGAGKRSRRPPRRYADLDHLAGTWPKRRADEFDRALADQRKIDAELWS
ncbi:MAG: hypothetical protein HYY17_05545 [Planctomycetes bacterium]|nr:hypothetical protein [Planctomycetota bacterium]